MGFASGGGCWSRFYFANTGNHGLSPPVLAAGIHRPERRSGGGGGGNFDFYVNYYHASGAPQTINVVVDGSCNVV